MRRLFFAWSFATLVCFASVLTAQDTFTDSGEFEAALSDTATIVCEDFSGITDVAQTGGHLGGILSEFPTPQILSFGTLTSDSLVDSPQNNLIQLISADGNMIALTRSVSTPTGETFTNPITGEEEPRFVFSSEVAALALGFEGATATTIDLDPASGDVEGFCFEYIGAADFCITVFDGDTVVDTILAPDLLTADQQLPLFIDPIDPTVETAVICWSSSSQANVTRVELKGAAFLANAKLAFGDFEPTCQDLLQDVIDALIVKRELANPYDQVWIDEAIFELELAQSPDLWATGNRLSDYGEIFFGHNFYATYYLQCVSDQYLVDDCLVGVQDLLGCVVDAEIEFAMENPDARSNLLYYAEYFEHFADAFADAEFYLEAVLLYFYAWLFANHA